jgi:hypothetical protein
MLTKNFNECKDYSIKKYIDEDDYRLIVFLLSQMHIKFSRSVRVKLDTYKQLFNFDCESNSENFKMLSEKLIKKNIKIEKGKNKFIIINLFSSVSYSKDSLEIRFNYDLVPFLIRIKNILNENKNLKTEKNHKILKPYNNVNKDVFGELSQIKHYKI